MRNLLSGKRAFKTLLGITFGVGVTYGGYRVITKPKYFCSEDLEM